MFREHAGNCHGPFRELSGTIQAPFRHHLGNSQGPFRHHSENVRGTCREHSGNFQTLACGRTPIAIQGFSKQWRVALVTCNASAEDAAGERTAPANTRPSLLFDVSTMNNQ
jgi:hypothetical protein